MLDRNAISPNPVSVDVSRELGGQRATGEGEREEGLDARVACVPCMPTQDEVDIHNATHVPFRSWCPFCVAGKAKANPHLRKIVIEF